jgi:hypothetical protein
LHEQNCAIYKYVGFAFTVGIPLDKRGPRMYKAVDKRWGAASYFSVGAFNAPNLPSWISFGGFDTKLPMRHSG